MRYEISVTVFGEQITVHTNAANATTAKVAKILINSLLVAVFINDALLIPGELFEKAPIVYSGAGISLVSIPDADSTAIAGAARLAAAP